MSRQTQLKVEENSIATKTIIVARKVEKNYKKNVVMQKILSRHNEELKAEVSVATENGREMRQAKTICRNKDFNVATNNSASDIFRVCCDTEFSLISARQ